MEKLPRDVLELIVRKLEDARDLCSFASTANLFADLSWSSLVVRKNGENMARERVKEFIVQSVEGVLSSSNKHNLQKLVISFWDAFMAGERLDWTQMRFERLSVTLRELDLRLSAAKTNSSFWSFINGFQSLSVLKLGSIVFENDSARPITDGISLSFPSLTSISFQNVNYLWSEDITSLQRASPQLESLVVIGTMIRDRGDRNVVDIIDAHRLRQLVCNIPRCVIRLTRCSHLQRLEIDYSEGLEFSRDSDFSRLQEVELLGIPSLTNAGLSSLLYGARMLETLVVSPGISAKLENPIVIESSALKSLKYDACGRPRDVLQLDCVGLESLELTYSCRVIINQGSSCGKLSRLCIKNYWGSQHLSELLSMGVFRERLVHLDLGTLEGRNWLVLTAFFEHLSGSCLKRADVSWCFDPDVDVALAPQFIKTAFDTNKSLECLRILVPKLYYYRNHRAAFSSIQVPGFVVDAGIERKLAVYSFYPNKEACSA